ncbi:MAG: endonuclease/exonuclease/phosphatase family protein [Chlorobi bacterium]|nr:endonuclease/exonuclease/phosphatase family protein [Chlorobiota bacterium]
MKQITISVFLMFVLSVNSIFSQTGFSVLQLNVWQEGTMTDSGLIKIATVIDSLEPGVVTFSEVRNFNNEDWIEKIKNELKNRGNEYYGEYVAGDVGLISKFPISDTKIIFDETRIDSGSLIAYLLDINGQKVWVCPGHLDYKYYAVYLPRGYSGGKPDWKMIDDGSGNPHPVNNVNTIIEYNKLSRKDEAIKAFIRFFNLHNEYPVILGIDLNGASHLDWTEANKDNFGHNGLAIEWNNTKALEDAGYIDSYRSIYPDEVNYPGITWPAYPTGYKKQVSWTPQADERDRIDYIFYKGKNLKASKAYLVGPGISFSHGEKINLDEYNDPWLFKDGKWPSDHFGVLVEFNLGNQTPD